MVSGVLALQGDWAAHAAVLRALGHTVKPVRCQADLEAVSRLVIPGGESTAIIRLLEDEGLDVTLRTRIESGLPVLATCAGVIVLAKSAHPMLRTLAVLDIDVERNAYGRQVHSTVGEVSLGPGFEGGSTMEGVFIRAPKISRTGDSVDVLGWWKGDPVLVRQGAVLAATFHPELTADRRIHELFRRIGDNGHG